MPTPNKPPLPPPLATPIPILLLLTITITTTTFPTFGPNKPHMLFHLGDRRPVSTNLGWGYWSGSEQLRLKYQNTDAGLYAHMVVHDGEGMFYERVEDRRSRVGSEVRYQLGEGEGGREWEVEIEMGNQGENDVVWFLYMSVENNDYRLIDHEKYTSFIHLVPGYKSQSQKDQIQIKCLSLLYPNQTLTIHHSKQSHPSQHSPQPSPLKIFGIAANISQTHTIYPITDTFRRIVRVYRGEEKLKDPKQAVNQQERKAIQWEARQVQFIRQDNWGGKSYVIVYVYGVLQKGGRSKIYVTNSTKGGKGEFNHQKFKQQQQKTQTHYQKNLQSQSPEHTQFLTHTISNLLAGLTFYFGRLYTQNSLTVHKQDYSYSFTPSRLIFPRSFLWDDGFHQSVMVHYNAGMVLDVLTNWMGKIDLFGWVGREQIRGGEVSMMMPDERFVFQDWFEMNPPTLMLSILTLLDKSKQSPELKQRLNLFLQNYLHKLQSWYRYFKSTQSHQSLDYAQTINSTDRYFRWHCKDECSKGNFMGSGLDDYPRRGNQSQIAKQHVDLMSWLYFFADSLERVAGYMEGVERDVMGEVGGQVKVKRNRYTRRVKFYRKEAQGYIHQLYDKFYDKSDDLFKDIVVVNSDLYFQKFVDKIGYINLFPFFTGMLAEQKYKNAEQFDTYNKNRIKSLKKCLQIMSDQKLLMSQDGLRSLSFSDPLYGTDQNYWRGAVWLPINFLTLRALKLYYWHEPTPALREQVHALYSNLRQRLINSVYNTYKETGYLYQNYYEGKGHRGFPFYGWTATIVNIITEQY